MNVHEPRGERQTSVPALLFLFTFPRESTDGLLFSFHSEERVKCATAKVKRKRRVTAPDISIMILIPPDSQKFPGVFV